VLLLELSSLGSEHRVCGEAVRNSDLVFHVDPRQDLAAPPARHVRYVRRYADVQALVCCVAPMPLSPTPRPAVPRLGGPAETDPLMHGLRRLNLCATSDLMTWYPGENLVAKLSSCGADRFMSKISSVENVVS
jgi:hypothetical protein